MRRISIITLLTASMAAAGTVQSVPVFFVANHGQAPVAVRFMAQGSGLNACFLQGEILFGTNGARIHMYFEGAQSSAQVEGDQPLPGRANFLTGDQRHWHRSEPMFGAVRYRGLYPGIDMKYGASGRQLKSEFIVAPGADFTRIRIRYSSVR